MTTSEEEIKTSMKLYTHMDRIHRELEELGFSTADEPKLTVEVVNSIDSLHYLGDEAMESAIRMVPITKSSKVLDIGSGLGGPARYLAHHTGCSVTAMELQADLSEIGMELTERCGLNHLVKHVNADFLQNKLPEASFTTIVSWLVFLHIADASTLFQKCHQVLQQDGVLYVEDFCRRGTFTSKEQSLLQSEVAVHHELPTWDQLEATLKNSGFEIVGFEDMTEKWTAFVCDRYEKYVAAKDRHERVHGKDKYQAMLTFYDAVKTLFVGGHLQGIKYIARKN